MDTLFDGNYHFQESTHKDIPKKKNSALEHLIAYDPNLNKVDNPDNLHLYSNEYISFMEYIIPDRNSYSPRKNYNTKYINSLLDKIQDINKVNWKGESPLSVSLEYLNLLFDCDNPETFYHGAEYVNARAYSNSTIERILMMTSDEIINFQDRCNGKTPLMLALEYQRDNKILSKILNSTYDKSINLVDEDGKSAIFYALMCKNVDIIHQLLCRNPDLNIQDKYGETPLTTSLFYHRNNLDLINRILDRNPEITTKDKWGNDPLYKAKQWGVDRRIYNRMLHMELEQNIKKNGYNLGNIVRSFIRNTFYK